MDKLKVANDLKKIANQIRPSGLQICANFPSQDQKNLLIRLDRTLMENLEDFGVRNINNSGFVIHHYKGEREYINPRPSYEEVKRMRQEIQNYEKDKSHKTEYINGLMDEVERIVLIPGWFHDYLHNTLNSPSFGSRTEVYKKLKETVLNNLDEIKQIKFEHKTMYGCLQSINRLIALLPQKEEENFKKKVKDDLKKIYSDTKNKVQEYFRLKEYTN